MKIDLSNVDMSDIYPFELDEFPYTGYYDSREIARGYRHYFPFVREHPAGVQVCELLSRDPRVKRMIEDINLVRYNDTCTCPLRVEDLAVWVLRVIHKHGHEVAEDELEEFLNTEKIQILMALWVLGIGSEGIIDIGNGFRIIPVDLMPDSREKEEYMEQYLKEMDPHQQYVKPLAAIVYQVERKKVFTQKEFLEKMRQGTDAYKNEEEEKQYSSKIFHSMIKISYLLNAINGISCIPYYMASYGLTVPPILSPGSTGGSHVGYSLVNRRASEINIDIVGDLNRLIRAFDALSDKNQRSIYRILIRLMQAKSGADAADKILDLCIALEMMLFRGNCKQRRDLLSKFSKRGCCFIRENTEHRRKVRKQLERIYKLRNRVAHGDVLSKEEEEEIFSDWREYVSLAEDITRKFISNPNVNWD